MQVEEGKRISEIFRMFKGAMITVAAEVVGTEL